jgi:hypothetical protein
VAARARGSGCSGRHLRSRAAAAQQACSVRAGDAGDVHEPRRVTERLMLAWEGRRRVVTSTHACKGCNARAEKVPLPRRDPLAAPVYNNWWS